jgi:hypothetical protein
MEDHRGMVDGCGNHLVDGLQKVPKMNASGKAPAAGGPEPKLPARRHLNLVLEPVRVLEI